MKNYKIPFLFLIGLTVFSCKDDDINVELNNGPYESILVGSSENAYGQTVNDTLTAVTQMTDEVNSEFNSYDLNGDGIDDVTFTAIGGGDKNTWGVGSYFLPLDSNETVLTSCKYTDLKTVSVLETYDLGTKISDELSFEPYTRGGIGIDLSFDGSGDNNINCWGNNTSYYIAVKVNTITGAEYAWIKLATNTSEHKTQIFIESYGCRE